MLQSTESGAIQLIMEQGRGISAMTWVLTALLLCALPLLSLTAAEIDLSHYFEFPARTRYIMHAQFSWAWWTFYAVSGVILALLLASVLKIDLRVPRQPGFATLLSLGLLLYAWALAWNRWEWAQGIQLHTFIFLWLAYILFVNCALRDIHGVCPLTSTPGRYLVSFPLSAIFWWIFETLNRFTQNWHYQNVESFTPGSYALFATFSFATVLPSIWVTKEFLSHAFLKARFPSLTIPYHPLIAAGAIALSALLLLALPFFPDFLFASIWGAPLLLAIAIEMLRGRNAVVIRNAALWSCTGVLCGFLWELWNVHSLARWGYWIAYVQKFYLFEMPIVGYAGYIPFGLLCGMVVDSLRAGGSDAE